MEANRVESALDRVDANARHENQAAAALSAYAKRSGYGLYDGSLDVGADVLREVAGDLLTDVFHLARRNDLEPETIVDAAFLHMNSEAEADEDDSDDTGQADEPQAWRAPQDLWQDLATALNTLEDAGISVAFGNNSRPGNWGYQPYAYAQNMAPDVRAAWSQTEKRWVVTPR